MESFSNGHWFICSQKSIGFIRRNFCKIISCYRRTFSNNRWHLFFGCWLIDVCISFYFFIWGIKRKIKKRKNKLTNTIKKSLIFEFENECFEIENCQHQSGCFEKRGKFCFVRTLYFHNEISQEPLRSSSSEAWKVAKFARSESNVSYSNFLTSTKKIWKFWVALFWLSLECYWHQDFCFGF